MRKQTSFYGDNHRSTVSGYDTGISGIPGIARTITYQRVVLRPRRRRTAFAVVSVAVLAFAVLASAIAYGGLPNSVSRISTITTLPGFTLQYQHSDNVLAFPCTMCLMWMNWHAMVPVLWDDVKYGGAPLGPPGDNMYGAVGAMDDCPHCTVYSGPACLQMITAYRGGGAAPPQDLIYDLGELDGSVGEIAGNSWVERHGVGMTDGYTTTPPEIQTVFSMLIGPVYQHNQWNATALTAPQLMNYILGLYPVLWDDHAGWPANMDPTFPTADPKEQGHYKVIAGYNDNNTASDFSDDWALIYDPWPEYNDHGILPANAIPGPSGTFDPYWLPVSLVLGDPIDLFLVEFAAIPEFSGLLIPVLGLSLLVVVAVRTGSRREET